MRRSRVDAVGPADQAGQRQVDDAAGIDARRRVDDHDACSERDRQEVVDIELADGTHRHVRLQLPANAPHHSHRRAVVAAVG